MVDAKDILKAVLEKTGPITISDDDLHQVKDKRIGSVESFDDPGKYQIYTHDARAK